MPAVAGVHAPEQGRPERAPDVARELPAERDQHEAGDDARRVVVRRAEELVAVAVDDEDADERGQEDERLDARALDRAAAQLPREADVPPGVAVRGEELPEHMK